MAKHNSQTELAVIGLGRFGAAVALTLMEHHYTVLGIDRNIRIVQDLADELTQTVSLDSTDEDALKAVDIGIYPTVICAMTGDLQSSILCTIALKNLGVKRVICTATNEREKSILLKIGADQVVLPEYDAGRRLAQALAMPTLLDQLPLGRGYAIQDVQLPASFVGHTVHELDLRRDFGLTLIAIRRKEEVLVSPPSDQIYERGDTLVIIGKIQDLERLGNVE